MQQVLAKYKPILAVNFIPMEAIQPCIIGIDYNGFHCNMIRNIIC
jgi:hypothetical protein